MAVTLDKFTQLSQGEFVYSGGGIIEGIPTFVGEGWDKPYVTIPAVPTLPTPVYTVGMSRTNEDGQTEIVEMQIHMDGTVHVEAGAMLILMEELGFK